MILAAPLTPEVLEAMQFLGPFIVLGIAIIGVVQFIDWWRDRRK